MPNTIHCPQCNRELRVPDELLGKKVKCPACSTTFTASIAASEAEPPPLTPVDQNLPDCNPRPMKAPMQPVVFRKTTNARLDLLGIEVVGWQ